MRHWWAGIGLAGALALAGCGGNTPVVVHARKAPAPPDWFHRQLALAHHARLAHVPASDVAGARAAYNAIMVPACQKVTATGPDKYRARCSGLIARAAAKAPASTKWDECDDHDDSHDSQAAIVACSD